MGLLDTVARSVLKVDADTSGARNELGKLGDAEKKLGETRASATAAGNAGLEKWVGLAGQVGIAMGIAKVGIDAFNAHAQKMRLESAAAGVSIDRLAQSSHGLKTNLELLEHAAVLNKTAFHATQGQMENAERAMAALEQRGNNSNEVWSAMKEALTKGATEPLEKFGITINKAGLDLDAHGNKLDEFGRKQETVRRIYEALGKTADEAGDLQDNAITKTDQGFVRLHNTIDVAKDKLGEVVAQVGGPLLNALASAIERTMKLIDVLPKGPGGQSLLTFMPGIEGWNKMMGALDAWDKNWGVKGSSWMGSATDMLGATRGAILAGSSGSREGAYTPTRLAVTPPPKASGKAGPYDVRSLVGATSLDTLPGAGGFSTSLGAATGMQGFDLDTLAQTSALTDEWFQKIDAFEQQHDRQVSLLEQVFGPAHEIDLYVQGFDKLGSVFNSLTDAVGASYEAIVTGQGSVSKAFKTVFADGLMAMGKSSAVEAIRETALGFGSLALGPIGGASASAHFTSAAMHAAVAVAAGAAAHSIGTSAQAAASDKAAAKAATPSTSSGASSGSQSSGGGTTIVNNATIVYSDAFAADSPRQRALHARQLIQQALGGAGGHDS